MKAERVANTAEEVFALYDEVGACVLVPAAADLLGVHRSVCRDLCQRGKLRVFVVCGDYQVPVRDIRSRLESRSDSRRLGG